MPLRAALRISCYLLVTLLLSTAAQAQLFRAYVASTGSDANPCTLPLPCRLLPAALAAVADGGEIWMLDSANYNTATVTIGKSVSILAVPGAVGSVVAVGGPAISITAGSLTVALRNLVIVPLLGGAGTDGVFMTGASNLSIEDSLIANLPGQGVFASGTGNLKITRTIIRNNGSYAVGLENGPSATITGTQMLQNYGGVSALGNTTSTNTTAAVSDSVISGGSEAVNANTQAPGATTKIFVTRSTIHGVQYALLSGTLSVGSALVSVSNSMITNNNFGWYQSGTGSVLESSGNNHIRGNSSNFGTLTNVGLQ